MTELSDYRRIVERPAVKGFEATIRIMREEGERYRRCISMAMGCLDPLSRNPDERLAWQRLHDAMEGREPRSAADVGPLPERGDG